MDRFDEAKPVHTSDRNDEERPGDVLGIAGGPVVKAPDDPSTDYDQESIARRRARALGEDEIEETTSTTSTEPTPGATGIDMGAGGTGTDIKER